MRQLPPLNAVKAFEAAARLNSIQKAADELCVTHGAVSRQVKQLEEWLGVTLFERSHRAISLTAVGRAYRQTASSALELIHEGTSNIKQRPAFNVLGIATTHSVASKWLMPRLPSFSKRYPQVEMWITLSQQLSDFTQPAVDVALRVGQGPWPGLHCIPLMQDRLITVCSPHLLEQDMLLNTPADLAEFTLLHDQDPTQQWRNWFKLHNSNYVETSRGPQYSSADVLIQAAINGQGIALVSEILVATDIREGRLVRPLEQPLELGNAFWLVMPEQNRNKPTIEYFYEWIKSEIEAL